MSHSHHGINFIDCLFVELYNQWEDPWTDLGTREYYLPSLIIECICIIVGLHSSVVACPTYEREIAGSIPGCAEYTPTMCS